MAKKQTTNPDHVVFFAENGDKLVARDDVQAAAFKKIGLKPEKEESTEE